MRHLTRDPGACRFYSVGERSPKAGHYTAGTFMPLPRLVVCGFSMAALVLSDGSVCAQDFPSKPIRIVSAEAGGGNDFAARVVAQGLGGLRHTAG
jgi:hypothetical protein